MAASLYTETLMAASDPALTSVAAARTAGEGGAWQWP